MPRRTTQRVSPTTVKYAAQQLPVLYQHQSASTVEVNKPLKSTVGFAANSLGDFMPEYFHF